MTLPRYIPYGAVQVYAPPFTAKRVRHYGFLLPADSAAIQRSFIDPCLNVPAAGKLHFRSAISAVFLTFTHIDSIFSEDPVYRACGSFHEQETSFWVLMEEENSHRFYWGLPYIFVNNPMAIAMGREIYGFHKELGWFDIPEDPSHANLFTLDAMTIRHFSPRSESTRQRLIDVERTFTDTYTPLGDTIHSMGTLLRLMKHLFLQHESLRTDLLLALRSGEDLLKGRIPIALLKQIRDVADGNGACYQAIIEAHVNITRFYGGCFLPDDYRVTINPYDSHPIQKDLGLPAGPIPPIISMSAMYDFHLPSGKPLWQAGTAPR